MKGRSHRYRANVSWSEPGGTTGALNYSRNHLIRVPNKPDLSASSDPAFGGDPARLNPEDLLVASLSSCHMLWYLNLCARSGISVTSYVDEAEGVMIDEGMNGGRFERVVLRPRATIAPGGDLAEARRLHHQAHRLCFIANSVNFPVDCEPVVEVAAAGA
jgi:organic hydroperoxide reductase OsmC/OhrA